MNDYRFMSIREAVDSEAIECIMEFGRAPDVVELAPKPAVLIGYGEPLLVRGRDAYPAEGGWPNRCYVAIATALGPIAIRVVKDMDRGIGKVFGPGIERSFIINEV